MINAMTTSAIQRVRPVRLFDESPEVLFIPIPFIDACVPCPVRDRSATAPHLPSVHRPDPWRDPRVALGGERFERPRPATARGGFVYAQIGAAIDDVVATG